jgi:5-methylcytosine-specific restriction protein A
MTFGDVYGPLGDGYIHVHHLVEVSSIGTEYVVDPVRDLRPVCANCHAMLHRQSPALSIDTLKRHLFRGPRGDGPK